MNKLFYGVSTSQGDADVKEVTIYNPLEEEMAPGDVLAVYFAHGNTVEAPSMVVSNTSDIAEETTDSTDEPIIDDSNDSNTDVDPAPLTEDEQTALSEDHGIEIKTHDVTADVDYMWQSGEVCLFVLTSQQFNTNIEQGYDSTTEDAGNNALYYMLIRGCRADSEWYGLTKLFTDEFSEDKQYKTFEDWIKADDENDKVLAATPYLIKLLARKILGITPTPDPPGPTPTPTPSLGITYVSALPTGTDEYKIGELTVGDTIYNVVIPTPISAEDKEYTSDFINDADIITEEIEGVNVKQHKRKTVDPGSYFITNVVDSDLYLYKGDGNSRGIYLTLPAGASSPDIQSPVEGGMKKYAFLIRNGNNNGTLINSGFPNNPLTIYGSQINLSNSGSPLLTINKPIKEGDETIQYNYSSLKVSAPRFKENGIFLSSRYSGKLYIRSFRLGVGSTSKSDTGNFSWRNTDVKPVKWENRRGQKACEVNKKSNSGHQKIFLDRGFKGYRPLGIVSYDISYADPSLNDFKPKGDSVCALFLNLYELYLDNITPASSPSAEGSAIVHYAVKNLRDEKASFIIDIKVLCEKVQFF